LAHSVALHRLLLRSVLQTHAAHASRWPSAWHRKCIVLPRIAVRNPLDGQRSRVWRAGRENGMTKILRGIAPLAALCLGLGTASLAGAGEKQSMSGQVTDKEGSQLTIQSASGERMSVHTDAETTIRGPQGELGMNDIDRGDRVQVTAMQDSRGQSVATEIRVESSSGAGAGCTGTPPASGEEPPQLNPSETPQRGMPGEME